MKLHYFKSEKGNFGDDLNAWIWDWLLPGWREASPEVTLVGVGTLINDKQLKRFRKRRMLVLGAGVGYGGGLPPKPYPQLWDFRAVRGPLSAKSLGLDPRVGIIDPAALIAEMPEFQSQKRDSRPVFIPHHVSLHRHDWAAACEKVGLAFVSPEHDAKFVIRKISSAPLVITEAMHGAIVADSFGVPWLPVKIGAQFNRQKWCDWFESTRIDAAIKPMFPRLERQMSFFGAKNGNRVQRKFQSKLEGPMLTGALRNLLDQAPILSSREILSHNKARFRIVLEGVRQDYQIGV